MLNKIVATAVILFLAILGSKVEIMSPDCIPVNFANAYTCHVNGSRYNNDYAQQHATEAIENSDSLASIAFDSDDIMVSKEFNKKKVNKKLEKFKEEEKKYNYAVLDNDIVPHDPEYYASYYKQKVYSTSESDMSNLEGVKDELTSTIQPTNSDKSAMLIYSWFKSLGINDNVTAAVLGFWYYESELDPTCVEGDYLLSNSRFNITEEKQTALNDLDSWCKNFLFPKRSNGSFNQKGYLFDGKYICGGGVPAFTAGHMYDIQANARNFGVKWYDLAFQMAFEFAVYGNSYFKNINNKSSSSSVDSACINFLGYHQYRDGRTSCHRLYERIQKAYEFKEKFADWGINEEFNARVKNLINNSWKKHSWEDSSKFSIIEGSIPNVG